MLHYLHDACAHLAHAHELESSSYQLKRLSQRRYFIGGITTQVPSQWLRPLLKVGDAKWIEHKEHGLRPAFTIVNQAGAGVNCQNFALDKHLTCATEDDLILIESDFASQGTDQ